MQKLTGNAAIWAALVALVACSTPAPPVDPGIDNQSLGIRLASSPPGFTVLSNQGAVLELAAVGDPGQGRLRFLSGPEDHAVNLVAALSVDRSRIEALPDGDYKGGQELVGGPLGTAFYSRGRFLRDGATVEETRIFTIHPSGDRMLTLSYEYPAGDDSSARVTELLEVFAEVEGIVPDIKQQ